MNSNNDRKERLDAYTKKSDKKGLVGFFERFIRTFRSFSFLLVITPMLGLSCVLIGLAIVPGTLFFQFASDWSADFHFLLRTLVLAMSIGIGYLLYGFSIIFVIPVGNFLMPFRVKPWRGPWQSFQSIPWYFHNALNQIPRYTFLNLITPTPLNLLYYRMMGMKIGKGVVINTTNISDPCMITLEDNVTIGGSVTMFGHYGQKGYLVIAPVIIKRGANIGLKASIMGNVVVGENVQVAPHEVLLPKTRLEKKIKIT